MKNTIDIEIQIDPTRVEPKVVILTSRMTPDIDNIVHAIENSMDDQYAMLTVYEGSKAVFLSQREIIRVFIEKRRLVVQTEQGRFIARGTLTDMESVLNHSRFLRISRSEIINMHKVSSFDFSLAGTIRVHFDNGATTWVARRYMRSIQETLGLA